MDKSDQQLNQLYLWIKLGFEELEFKMEIVRRVSEYVATDCIRPCKINVIRPFKASQNVVYESVKMNSKFQAGIFQVSDLTVTY